MRSCRKGFSLLVLLLAASAARATPPNKFTVQTVLRNNLGQLQSLSVSASVNLFTAQVGGTQLTSNGATILPVQNGLLTLTINEPSILTILGTNPEVWAQITVAGMGTFPRQQITSQPFALQSLSVSCDQCLTEKEVHLPSGSSSRGVNFNAGTNRSAVVTTLVPTGNTQCLVTGTLYIPSGPAGTTGRPTWRLIHFVNSVFTDDDTGDITPFLVPSPPFGTPVSMSRAHRFGPIGGPSTHGFGCQIDVPAGSSWIGINSATCNIAMLCT